MAGLLSAPLTIHSPSHADQALPPPNISPQPSSQKPIELTAKTMKFFDRMLTQFFARQKPDSTQAKPRFMKNTSMPVTSTQTVSAMTLRSAAVGPEGTGAAACLRRACRKRSCRDRLAASSPRSTRHAAAGSQHAIIIIVQNQASPNVAITHVRFPLHYV